MADAQHDNADQHRIITAREKIATCHTKPEEINTVVEALSGIAHILRSADPIDKADIYRQPSSPTNLASA